MKTLSALAFSLVVAATLSASATAIAAPVVGDPVKGKTQFAACGACHAVTAGKNGVGPTLFGVVGRKAGTEKGFTFSPAMKTYGKAWTPALLDAYLKAPRTEIPGNVMPFAGISDEQKRANIIAYMKSLK